MTWVAGADGCRAGWAVVLYRLEDGHVRCRTVPHFEALLALAEAPAVIALDMVIGLPEAAERGGRACDRAARRLLGWPRACSVFSPPARGALGHPSYAAALAANRASGPDGVGLSRQAFHLFPKLREVDRGMTPALQARVKEIHPELSFREAAGGLPIRAGKRTRAGRAERIVLLKAQGFPDVEAAVSGRTGTGADDVLDAHAACWTARRLYAGHALRLPEPPAIAPVDARGLRMEIWR